MILDHHHRYQPPLLVLLIIICATVGGVLCDNATTTATISAPNINSTGAIDGNRWIKRSRYEPLNTAASISLASFRNQLKIEGVNVNPGEQFHCPTQFGYYRDSKNCAAYYICSFGIPLMKNCSTGLYFSERLQICDWPTNVPCEKDFASYNAAQSSIYNLIDENRSPLSINRPEHPAANSSSPGLHPRQNVVESVYEPPPVPAANNRLSQPLFGDLMQAFILEQRKSNNASSMAKISSDQHLKSTMMPDTLLGRSAETRIPRVERRHLMQPQPLYAASYDAPTAKYVVDGFDVATKENFTTTTTTTTAAQPFPINTALAKSQNVFSNSTFMEISKMNTSSDKLFQKRNDFEYFPVTFSNLRNANAYEPSSTTGYYRHQPQSGELILTNANPYMQNAPPRVKPKANTYYQYETDSGESFLPYRSRYQHKYQSNPERDVSLFTTSPKLILEPRPEKPKYLKTEIVPIEINPVRRKLPKVYIEVISNDNFSTPYIIEPNDHNQDVFVVQSGSKKLNYEINERLLAPYKQRQPKANGNRLNWLPDKPQSFASDISRVTGLNRYSSRNIKPEILLKAIYPGQVRKKIIRKKKVNRLPTSSLAASSSSQLGHASTGLLTGNLVTQPILLKAKPIRTYEQPASTIGDSSKQVNTEKVHLSNRWKPVSGSPPSTTTVTSTTHSPLFIYKDISNGRNHQLESTTPSPRVPTQRNRPQTVRDPPEPFIEAIQSKPVPSHSNTIGDNGSGVTSKPTKPVIPRFTSKPRRVQLNLAQYNRYVVIPPKPNRTETYGNTRFVPQNMATNGRFDIQRISESSPVTSTEAPLRVTLEDYIKKTIEVSSSDGHQQEPSISAEIPKIHNTETLNERLVHPVAKLMKPVSGFRRSRKYRPLITLDQSVPSIESNTTTTTLTTPSTTTTSTTTATPVTMRNRFTFQRLANHSSGNTIYKNLIKLEDPATIISYSSPRNNEVDGRHNETNWSNNSGRNTPTPGPWSTSAYVAEDSGEDIGSNLIQTNQQQNKEPRHNQSNDGQRLGKLTTPTITTLLSTPSSNTVTITTTTTTTVAPPKVTLPPDYYNYEDYDYDDYNTYSNGTSTTTTTTTTTTTAPVKIFRRITNTTSNKPRPTKRRLVIKDPNAGEAIKIASRPKPLYPQPKALVTAAKCDKKKCRLPDCRCGGSDIPGNLSNKQIPQLVMLTFDDGVNDLNWELYEELLNSGRKNPNGCPIKATFYVSHEWTDYGQVQTLYSRGHEIASHTISHRFGEKFSKEEWIKEINGQREILNLYGGVAFEDIRGMRAPFLQTGGNNMFEMLYETNFTYDSSLPVQENSPPYWPYTLDYALSHSCNIPPCPTRSFPGVWEVGMVMWSDLRGGRCSMGDACTNPPDEAGVYEMLIKNFNRHYKNNRAPFSLYYHSAWFNTQHHRRGFMKFFDEINQYPEVYLVTTWQALQWVREPTQLDKLAEFEPFKCNHKPKPSDECTRAKVCNVNSKQGSRTLRTCQECPTVYPWIGNNGFGKVKSG